MTLKKILIKKAEQTDLKGVFDIRNDPAIRSLSLNQDEISYEEHLNWGRAFLADSRNFFFVLSSGSSVGGYCRLDGTKRDDGYYISIAILTSFQGQGYGGSLLRLAIDSVGEKKIFADILLNNFGSQRFFERKGFSLLNKSNELLHYVLEPLGSHID